MEKNKEEFVYSIFRMAFCWLSNRDVDTLYNRMKEYIYRDIIECADEDFNSSDVTCAIRRVLFNELEIQD